MDDNTIPPNQDFQIPQDQNLNSGNSTSSGDNSTVIPNSQSNIPNPVNNVNNINVSDPYDFVLQNSNPFINSQDNPISDISNSTTNPNVNTNTLLNDSTVQNQQGLNRNPIPDSGGTLTINSNTNTLLNNSTIPQDPNISTPNYTNPVNINADVQIPNPPLYNQNSDPSVSSSQQVDYSQVNSGFQNQQGYNVNPVINPVPPVQPNVDPNINMYNNSNYTNQSNTLDPLNTQSNQNYSNSTYTNQSYPDSSMQQQGQSFNGMYNQNANPSGFDGSQNQQNTQNQTQIENKKEDFLGVLSYVLFINFFIILISFIKKDEFLKFNSVQGFTFDITFLILFLIFNYLSHLLSSIFIFFLILEIILFTIWILFSIFLMYKVYNGDKYKFLFFGSIADIVR
jgi:uncharacterized membrane protein